MRGRPLIGFTDSPKHGNVTKLYRQGGKRHYHVVKALGCFLIEPSVRQSSEFLRVAPHGETRAIHHKDLWTARQIGVWNHKGVAIRSASTLKRGLTRCDHRSTGRGCRELRPLHAGISVSKKTPYRQPRDAKSTSENLP